MSDVTPIPAGMAAPSRLEALQDGLTNLPSQQTQAPEKPFSLMLSEGLSQVSDKVTHANDMVRAFAVDETIPVHQVTIALEEARMSMELATQIRQRLLESYQTIMNMQL